MWQNLGRNILLAIIICCGSGFAIANSFDNTYQVEVIIFEHTNPKRFAYETWPKFVGQLDISKAFNLNKINDPELQQNAAQEGISLVNPSQMLLKNDLNKIKANKTTRLIQSKAWQQIMITGDRATPIYFTDPTEQELAAIFAIKPLRNNMINVKMDLIYMLQPNEIGSAPGISEIRFTKEAKIKKKEVFYLDHPVLGVLVSVTPVSSN